MKKILTAASLLAALHTGATTIDELVATQLKAHGMTWSAPCSDARFVRRACLVATDRIPTAAQAYGYIQSPEKARLVDSLLASEGFVEMLTLKWGDLLRIKSEFPSNLWPNAVQAYNKWLTDHFRANTPYDAFVRELLTGTGSNFRIPQTNFYRTGLDRTPAAYADNIALLFLGERRSPIAWRQCFTQVKFKATSEWKEEILWLDTDTPPPFSAVKLDAGKELVLGKGTDFRAPFAAWLTSDANRQFARAMANRMWFWFMGRGITEPCDDLRADNPCTNAPLLEYLTDVLIKSRYDLRALAREILMSDTFAASSLSTPKNRADTLWFSHYPVRRLTAEQLSDALCDVTGVPDKYASRAPEPFTNYPEGTRATQIGDGTVTTAQLDLFGRPSRDLALESNRDNSLDSKQELFLLNSKVVYDKLRQSPLIAAQIKQAQGPRKVITMAYLSVLGRLPSPKEVNAVIAAGGFGEGKRSREAVETLYWALLNSNEFLFIN